MPRIIPLPPDPGMQVFLDYVSRLQQQQFQAEQARAQERAAQEQRLIVGIGAGAGAIGGLALAPALGAQTGLQAAGFALKGAAVGAQLGQSFVTGDIAGGLATASKAASGIIQSMDDQQFFGGQLSKTERSAFAKQAAKLGLTMKQAKLKAQQSGQMVPQMLQSMIIEQAGVEQIDDLFRDLNLPMTGSQAKEAAKTYEGGMQALISDLVEDQEERGIELAGQKKFAQTTGQKDAEVQAAAQREQMEMRFDPRVIAQRSADLKEIDLAVDDGSITLEQATQQKAAMPRLVPTLVPRKTPPNIQEITGRELAVVQIPLNDGSGRTLAVLAGLDRDGRTRVVDSNISKSIAPTTFEGAMLQLSPRERMDMALKVRSQLHLESPIKKPNITPEQVEARMRSLFDSTNFAAPSGGPQGQGQAQGAAQPELPPGPERAMQSWQALQQMAAQSPIETWDDENLVLALGVIKTILDDITKSDKRDPQALALMRQALDFAEVIDAQRNRNK